MARTRVGILIFDDVEVLDFCGPFEVFSVTRLDEAKRREEPPPFEVVLVAEAPGVVTTTGGMKVTVDYTLDDCPKLDVLVVPGGWGTRREAGNQRIIDFIRLRAPEDLYDIEGLTRSSRFVIARIWTRNDKGEKDQLGYICSAERLHNIKTKKGFTYGGKDDPVLLAFAQGDWAAPGEITAPWATAPMVAGDCRGSHNLHILPMPINSQTSYWSGPNLSAITLSCNSHTGRIGAISDQFAQGTPWDWVRQRASELAVQFRTAHGIKQPATLHEDELEYQEGWKERRGRLEARFEVKPPLVFNGNGKKGRDANVVVQGAGFTGQLANIDMSPVADINHFNIEKNPELQVRVMTKTMGLLKPRFQGSEPGANQ